MTEPGKKEGMTILDAVEEEPSKQGSVWKVFLWLVVVTVGTASIFLWGYRKSGQAAADVKNLVVGSKAFSDKDTQYADIINFAEKFTIMVFNVSYTDVGRQVDKVTGLMSDNMMSYYQEAFLDPKWVAFLFDNKAYVSYQQVERSTVENTDGTHYWVRVIGKCLFNSDARGPGSQIELPFNLVVVVKDDNGSLMVTNFQRL